MKKKIYYIAKSLPTLKAMRYITFESYSVIPSNISIKDINSISHLNDYEIIVSDMFPQLNNELIPIINPYSQLRKNPKSICVTDSKKDISFEWVPWMFHKTTTPIILDEALEIFLRKNSIYTRFMKNAKLHYKKFNIKEPLYISSLHTAFLWSITLENKNYWRNWDGLFKNFK